MDCMYNSNCKHVFRKRPPRPNQILRWPLKSQITCGAVTCCWRSLSPFGGLRRHPYPKKGQLAVLDFSKLLVGVSCPKHVYSLYLISFHVESSLRWSMLVMCYRVQRCAMLQFPDLQERLLSALCERSEENSPSEHGQSLILDVLCWLAGVYTNGPCRYLLFFTLCSFIHTQGWYGVSTVSLCDTLVYKDRRVLLRHWKTHASGKNTKTNIFNT